VPCDVTVPERVERAFATVEADGGPAQALVHGAASVEYRRARDLTPETFRTVIESILLGGFNTIHRWGSALLDAGLPGAAVAVTSCIAARGTPNVAHSSAGKAGLEALVRTLAREWGPAGLRLNAVGPGFFPVERTSVMWENAAATAPIVDMVALQRLGVLDEVVGPIVFLLTAAAGYVTGEVLVPDGGFRLTPHLLRDQKFETA
jgi:NAD(P)-dependent dehydrogenase (short-subunit alcohol dehydrogenase family)